MKIKFLFGCILFSAHLYGQQLTYVPDEHFEQELIDLGYDDVLDDSVLTANINSVGYLDLTLRGISDLTGIEDFIELTFLDCQSNYISEIDLSQNINLIKFNCFGNYITNLDLSQNIHLTELYCSNNSLINLDLSQNAYLHILHCGFNDITSLDLSQNHDLTTVYAPGNMLTSLIANGAESLEHLECPFNEITTLDLSHNSQLFELDCQFNQLTCLNVANGNNVNFGYLWPNGNQNLTCIEVDNVDWSISNWNNFNPQFSFSEDCNNDCSNCTATFSTDAHNACDSYNWIDGNTYTSSNNSATYTIPNSENCDSIITLDLTISHSSTSSLTETPCDSYTAPDGEVYTASGSYSATISNVSGCDSIIAIELTIYPTPNNDVIQNDYTLIAAETGAEYQWVDCDNENAFIIGETNQSFTTSSSGNYAVIVTTNECSNMSDCMLMNFTGTGNLSNTPKTLIKILDLIGRETTFKPNTPLIYVYDDGSIKKVFSVEY